MHIKSQNVIGKLALTMHYPRGNSGWLEFCAEGLILQPNHRTMDLHGIFIMHHWPCTCMNFSKTERGDLVSSFGCWTINLDRLSDSAKQELNMEQIDLGLTHTWAS